MKKNKPFRLIGNFFIMGGIILLAYIYYPLISANFFPQNGQPITSKSKDFTIQIPKINVNSKVIENVDPFSEIEYKSALRQGVAHAKNTSFPGYSGMIFLFAHSSGPPWEQTRNNTIFLKLGKVEQGDRIILYRKGEKFSYVVREKKEVWPSEVNYLLDNTGNELILQTCTPVGTDLKRLLVFAGIEK